MTALYKEYNKAIEIDPMYAKPYYNRGNAYLKKEQYNQAIQDFTKAIDIKSSYAKAYNKRGYTYFVKLKDKVQGCIDWKESCALDMCKNYNRAKQKGDCQ